MRNNTSAITNKFNPFKLDEYTANWIANQYHKDHYFLAYDNNTPVGFSMLRGWDEGFDIPSFGMFIDINKHGMGLGKQLLQLTLEKAKNLGCKKVRLSVFESNKAALNIYLRFGFIEISRSEIKLKNRAETKIIMIKDLYESQTN